MEHIPTITTLMRDYLLSKDCSSNSPLSHCAIYETPSVSYQQFPRVLSLEIPDVGVLGNRHTPCDQIGLYDLSGQALEVCGFCQTRIEEGSNQPLRLSPVSHSDTLTGNSRCPPVRVPLLTALPSLYPFPYSPVSLTSLRPPTRVSNDDDLPSRSLEPHGQQSRRGSL